MPGQVLSVPILSSGRGDGSGTFMSSMNQAQEAFEHSEMELESGDLGLLPAVEKELGQAIDAMSEIPIVGSGADKLSEPDAGSVTETTRIRQRSGTDRPYPLGFHRRVTAICSLQVAQSAN